MKLQVSVSRMKFPEGQFVSFHLVLKEQRKGRQNYSDFPVENNTV